MKLFSQDKDAHIIHFIGHSSRDYGLYVVHNSDNSRWDLCSVESLSKFKMNASALVILNSCQSGLPKKIAGYNLLNEEIDDYLSIDRLFLQKGCEVISTFSQIDNNIAAIILREFYILYYNEDNNMSPAECLKYAIKNLRGKSFRQSQPRLITEIKDQNNIIENNKNSDRIISLLHWSSYKISI